ncbi:MAG: hypothetical protein Tsb0015_04840 [Simkaniaceae bacterium]
MKMKINKQIPIALFTLSAAGHLFGVDLETRVAELENQMQQVRVVTPNGTCGANTALARPVLDECGECCGTGAFVQLSALYWHPKVGGTEFAYTDQDPQAQLPIKGQVKDMDFDWSWGLKAQIGYNSSNDGWDFLLNYTWFDSHGSASTSAGRSDTVIPLRGTSSLTADQIGVFSFCQKAKSQFDFTFNAVDLEMGRHYFVSESLAFRPHIGVKSAWIDLEQITRYTGGRLVTTSTPPGSPSLTGLGVNSVHVKDDNDFWGLGPRVGVNTNWYVGNGYSLFGDAAAAMLYGRYEVHHRERYSANKDINRIHLQANRHGFVPTMQIMLGAEYDRYINNDRNHIRIRLGFESQYYWRANQMIKVDSIDKGTNPAAKYDRYSEDVSMHGLTLDVRVDF